MTACSSSHRQGGGESGATTTTNAGCKEEVKVVQQQHPTTNAECKHRRNNERTHAKRKGRERSCHDMGRRHPLSSTFNLPRALTHPHSLSSHRVTGREGGGERARDATRQPTHTQTKGRRHPHVTVNEVSGLRVSE